MKLKDGFSGQRQVVVPPTIIRNMERHEIGKDLHITEIGFYPKATHHYRKRFNGSAEHIFIYCTNGQGWFEANSVRQRITENQFFIIPMGVPHSYGAAENTPWTIYWIHFKGDKALQLIQPLTRNKYNHIDIDDNSRIEQRITLFEEIYTTLEGGFTNDNMLYSALCLYHFLGTLIYIKQFRRIKSGKSKGDVVDLAIHYMRENMEKEVSMSNLVESLGYSTSQFNTIFKSRIGMNPKQFYLQMKIREACKYLNFTSMKVNQLCYKVGIDDPFYFSRIFTKIMGCSPMEYREAQKGGSGI
ncbi:MAG: AraC family transcriptional regulator [Prevotellaceae bacterium]|jgi:AraC-like DNA-binding protein/quercetin dioxygenase-like cupin family protein|nr:AraC family transcriptional regulator [Prevotellaceae bacterium]